MVATLAKRVIRFLKKRGYFQDDVDAGVPEEKMPQEELLPELQAASLQSRIAMGERKGKRVRRLGVPEYGEFGDFQAELKGSLCAVALTAIVHFLNGIFKLGLVGGYANRSIIFRFGVPAILGACPRNLIFQST